WRTIARAASSKAWAFAVAPGARVGGRVKGSVVRSAVGTTAAGIAGGTGMSVRGSVRGRAFANRLRLPCRASTTGEEVAPGSNRPAGKARIAVGWSEVGTTAPGSTKGETRKAGTRTPVVSKGGYAFGVGGSVRRASGGTWS